MARDVPGLFLYKVNFPLRQSKYISEDCCSHQFSNSPTFPCFLSPLKKFMTNHLIIWPDFSLIIFHDPGNSEQILTKQIITNPHPFLHLTYFKINSYNQSNLLFIILKSFSFLGLKKFLSFFSTLGSISGCSLPLLSDKHFWRISVRTQKKPFD